MKMTVIAGGKELPDSEKSQTWKYAILFYNLALPFLASSCLLYWTTEISSDV